jgi:2-oxo-4-hydroxy-4-carboxy-5-ureidoimidazoline decarboxylase
MADPEGRGLGWLNDLPHSEAVRVLTACCASRRWVAEVARRRPYGSEDELYSAAAEALDALEESDVDEALAAHPRIGERPAGAEGAWSRREQSGVASADDAVLGAISEGNRAYEARFGHVYLVCAAGRDADELLAVLRRRLRNDPVTERRVLREEMAKINRIRLGRIVGEEEAA